MDEEERPPELGDDEDDWFGEGSAFDSGEDLAAALFSLAGVATVPESAYAYDAPDTYEAQQPLGATGPTVTVGADAFQLIDRPATAPPSQAASPSPNPSSWSIRPQIPGTSRTSWSMRHSMQFLKTTEEVIKRLRNEATELTWAAATVAVNQRAPGKAAKR